MFGISKVIIFFAIIISTILYWTTSNVCRYNFTIEKKTNTLNIISAEVAPSLPMARVYYFRELNCNNVDLAWDIDRVIENLNTLSVMIYQELTTDIQGNPN
tara:strand:- start:1281 stop:1583 length:303 start_codon:yes stop_codon:yes gene_type:complete